VKVHAKKIQENTKNADITIMRIIPSIRRATTAAKRMQNRNYISTMTKLPQNIIPY
jgi:hypothetical protein